MSKLKSNKSLKQIKIKKPKIFLIAALAILFVIIIGVMTKVGAIPNFYNIDFLCPYETEVVQPAGDGDGDNCLISEISDGSCNVTAYKPVIYLYPQHEQQTSVKIDYMGTLSITYPDYSDGWNVVAYPDGKIVNLVDNKEYSYLFWEGVDNGASYDLTTGFVVKGSESAEFLQQSLSKLGLTAKEYNEFIVYWLPKMINNKYNLIHFATKQEYADRVKLDINPVPDSILRIFMVFKKLDDAKIIIPQNLRSFERKGFSVVEWGGTEL